MPILPATFERCFSCLVVKFPHAALFSTIFEKILIRLGSNFDCFYPSLGQGFEVAAAFLEDVVVGITFAELNEWVAPAQEVGTFIPYPFIAQGASPLLVYPQSDTLEALFGKRNHLITLNSEADLNSYLAAQAVLSPTVKLLHETAQWLTTRTGDGLSAEKFLRILIGNYLTATPLDQPDTLPAMLRDLSTEGGLNAQLRDHFTDQGVYETLEEGLNKLEKRFE